MLPIILSTVIYILGVIIWTFIDAKTSLSSEQKELLSLLKESKTLATAQIGDLVKISGIVGKGKFPEDSPYREEKESTELIAPLQSKKSVYLSLQGKEEITESSQKEIFSIKDANPFSVTAVDGQTIEAIPKADLILYNLHEEKIGPVIGLSEELDEFIKKHHQSLVGDKGFVRRKYFYETAVLEGETYFFIGRKLNNNSIEPISVSPYESTIAVAGTVELIDIIGYTFLSFLCGGFLAYGLLYGFFSEILGL
jgi:hypothetical protein